MDSPYKKLHQTNPNLNHSLFWLLMLLMASPLHQQQIPTQIHTKHFPWLLIYSICILLPWPHHQQIYTSRHVTFHDNIFPYHTLLPKPQLDLAIPTTPSPPPHTIIPLTTLTNTTPTTFCMHHCHSLDTNEAPLSTDSTPGNDYPPSLLPLTTSSVTNTIATNPPPIHTHPMPTRS